MRKDREEMEKQFEKLAALLREGRDIACLTGAGISTESKIPDFRSPNGIYKTTASAETFLLDRFYEAPEDFYRVIGTLYEPIIVAEPNEGHRVLAELEASGKRVRIATQNIDSLHRKAGSKEVYELHGTMETLTCTRCRKTFECGSFLEDLKNGTVLHCPCGGILKPDVVFFGEQLPIAAFEAAISAFEEADLVLVLGTSLTVNPAAELPLYRKTGTPLVIINREATYLDAVADCVIHGSIGETLRRAAG